MENDAAGEKDQELGGGLWWLGDLHTVRVKAVLQGSEGQRAEDCELGGRDGGEGDGEGQPCWVGWALTLCVVEAVGEFPAERWCDEVYIKNHIVVLRVDPRVGPGAEQRAELQGSMVTWRWDVT